MMALLFIPETRDLKLEDLDREKTQAVFSATLQDGRCRLTIKKSLCAIFWTVSFLGCRSMSLVADLAYTRRVAQPKLS
jgi:hypothetical protein